MMSFSGSVFVPHEGVTIGAAGAAILARLQAEKPKQISRHENQIQFRAGIFRMVHSWNQLVAICRGVVTIESEPTGLRIRYQIFFTELFIIATAAVLGFFGPAIVFSHNLSSLGKLGVLATAWIWLVGGNVFLTLCRFPQMLRRAVQESRR